MLIRRLFYMCFKRETEYKLNFILLCVSVAPLRLMFLLFALVLSSKIEVLYGWNAWDIAFLYGLRKLIAIHHFALLSLRGALFLRDWGWAAPS